MSQEL
ncbi:hypothetical protein MTR67_045397 [Solanum verrucosum]